MTLSLGDLVHLSVFGQHFLFVNSYGVASELFDKKSSNYSDRHVMPMVYELYVLRHASLCNMGTESRRIGWDGTGRLAICLMVRVHIH